MADGVYRAGRVSTVGLGVSALAAATFGLTWALPTDYRRSPAHAGLGMLGAAAWHLVSIPLLGLVSGALLLVAGLCALFDAEDRAARSSRRNAASVAAGFVTVVMGILLFTGTLTRLNQYFGFASSGLGAKI